MGFDEDSPLSRSVLWLWLPLVATAIIFGNNRPGLWLIAFPGAFALAVAVMFTLEEGWIAASAWITLTIGAVAAVFVLTGPSRMVQRYCEYGSVSKAQLDGCLTHVDEATIRGRDTTASQYARGNITGCLRDAGPFCEED